MYGKVQETPQSEKTNFYPLSPYELQNYTLTDYKKLSRGL